MIKMDQAAYTAKAAEMWEQFDKNERIGVRFGMFPAKKNAGGREGRLRRQGSCCRPDERRQFERRDEGLIMGALIPHGLMPYQFRQKLFYVVDLDERGWFKAHVENENGKDIFTLSNEDEGGWPGGDLDLVVDGYMRHARDVRGLHDYLQTVGLAGVRSTLEMVS